MLVIGHVPAPGVADQNVETSLIGAHPGKEPRDVSVVGVVAAHRGAVPSGAVDLVGGVLDRMWKLVDRAAVARRPPCDVDRGTTLAEHPGNSPACPAAGAGDEGDRTSEGTVRFSHVRQLTSPSQASCGRA